MEKGETLWEKSFIARCYGDEAYLEAFGDLPGEHMTEDDLDGPCRDEHRRRQPAPDGRPSAADRLRHDAPAQLLPPPHRRARGNPWFQDAET